MPRCIHCKQKFEKKYPNQIGVLRFCLGNDECTKEFYHAVKRKQIKEAERAKAKHKVTRLTANGYRSKHVQPLINELARIIDHDQPCIATGNIKGKMNGGHYHSVGSNVTLSLNLHNIHIQSEQSNNHKGGDAIRYRHGLINIYGQKYADFVDMHLCQCPNLNLTKKDLEKIKKKLTEINKELKALNKQYTPKQRIKMRNRFNKELGIYESDFSKFS